jgi:hypothetical protein
MLYIYIKKKNNTKIKITTYISNFKHYFYIKNYMIFYFEYKKKNTKNTKNTKKTLKNTKKQKKNTKKFIIR